jgi:iron(II)-dependent oxidoreductase
VIVKERAVWFAPAILVSLVLLAPGHAGAGRRAAPVARDTTMALIPSGEFVMGREGSGDDSPPHPVRLDAFYLDRHEVTNADYAEFCRATGRRLPKFWGEAPFRCGPRYPDHPVVFVSNDDARAYAAWRGKRLPTEAEWEYAARGGLVGRAYVNGDVLDSSRVNYTHSHLKGSVAVGSYEPNGYRLYDMAGNVQEWVADRYDAGYYAASPHENPAGPATGKLRVIRGGGWDTGPGCMGVGSRIALPGNWTDYNVGFRCAREAAPRPSSEGKP